MFRLLCSTVLFSELPVTLYSGSFSNESNVLINRLSALYNFNIAHVDVGEQACGTAVSMWWILAIAEQTRVCEQTRLYDLSLYLPLQVTRIPKYVSKQ